MHAQCPPPGCYVDGLTAQEAKDYAYNLAKKHGGQTVNKAIDKVEKTKAQVQSTGYLIAGALALVAVAVIATRK